MTAVSILAEQVHALEKRLDARDARAKPTSAAVAALERQAALRRKHDELTAQAIREGRLILSREEDATGRKFNVFHGDPEACWGAFKQPVRKVIGWNTKF